MKSVDPDPNSAAVTTAPNWHEPNCISIKLYATLDVANKKLSFIQLEWERRGVNLDLCVTWVKVATTTGMLPTLAPRFNIIDNSAKFNYASSQSNRTSRISSFLSLCISSKFFILFCCSRITLAIDRIILRICLLVFNGAYLALARVAR